MLYAHIHFVQVFKQNHNRITADSIDWEFVTRHYKIPNKNSKIFLIKKMWIRLRVKLLWMHVWTGKPSQYVTNHQGQLSLTSLWGKQIECQPASRAEVKVGHVHLCCVIPYGKWHSVAMWQISNTELYTFLTFKICEQCLICRGGWGFNPPPLDKDNLPTGGSLGGSPSTPPW